MPMKGNRKKVYKLVAVSQYSFYCSTVLEYKLQYSITSVNMIMGFTYVQRWSLIIIIIIIAFFILCQDKGYQQTFSIPCYPGPVS